MEYKKEEWRPSNLLYPLPVVMVSCQRGQEKPNIITIAWAGTVCTKPPMLSISVRKERHSYNIIKDSREFIVNVPSVKIAKAVDFCGVRSGAKLDKFEATGLTPGKAKKVNAPIIKECPINIECQVDRIIPLGSHDLFLANIVSIQVTESLIDTEGRLDLLQSGLVGYVHGHYHEIGKYLGHFGYSVRKKKGRSKRSNPRRSR